MTKISEISDFFNAEIPFYMAMSFDNVGLLVGRSENIVKKALISLDVTTEVIDEAIAWGAELIVTHHPVIFNAIKTITDEDVKGRQLLKLIENSISVISLHTNLDSAVGGVNDMLLKALGAEYTGLADPHGCHKDGTPYGITRTGILPAPKNLNTFLCEISYRLNVSGMRYWDAGKQVYRIACCGGAGSGDLETVFKLGCDTYVTADIKYDTYLWAKESGINLIDADHFCTENVVVPLIAEKLKEGFPDIDVKISEKHGQTLKGFR